MKSIATEYPTHEAPESTLNEKYPTTETATMVYISVKEPPTKSDTNNCFCSFNVDIIDSLSVYANFISPENSSKLLQKSEQSSTIVNMTSEEVVDKWIPNTDDISDQMASSNSQDYESSLGKSKDDKSSAPTSPSIGSDKVLSGDNLHNIPLMDGFIPLPPKLPVILSTESLLNISPYSSNTNDNDDFVIYSDSEVGSQNSLDLTRSKSPDETDSSPTRDKARRRSSKGSRSRRSSPRRESVELSPSPKPKRRIRRKSLKSEGSEKSHHMGGGYSLAPSTGKIFRNLLILEESLRQQVVQQKAMRTKYLTFMAILCALIASLSHHLYVSQTVVGGSLRLVLTFILLALVVTLFLYYVSGEYQKTIVMPRKFLSSTNKGLRQLNVRLVKIKIPLNDKLADLIREFSLYVITVCLTILHKIDPTTENNKNSSTEVFLVSCQLQCQPRIGIADVKLVLNARVFNTDVREGWELYRSEFWIREGVRRRNNLMNFVVAGSDDILDKEKLLKKDKRERRDRKRSNTQSTPVLNKLNDQNIHLLASKLEDVDQQSL